MTIFFIMLCNIIRTSSPVPVYTPCGCAIPAGRGCWRGCRDVWRSRAETFCDGPIRSLSLYRRVGAGLLFSDTGSHRPNLNQPRESIRTQSRAECELLGRDEIFSFRLADTDAGRKNAQVLTKQGIGPPDGFGEHPEDTTAPFG